MQEKQATVHLDDLPKIKRMYKIAVDNGKESFKVALVCGVEGEFLTSYAKYLIEHLENVASKQRGS